MSDGKEKVRDVLDLYVMLGRKLQRRIILRDLTNRTESNCFSVLFLR